mgnify:CR=1 FL=1
MIQKPIIDITDLRIGFDNSVKSELFYPLINASALKGDFIALIGRNGVGKSTFLRSIARLQPIVSGDVFIKGQPYRCIERSEFSKTLSFIPAEPIHAANMSVSEFVAIARYPYKGWFGTISNEDKDVVRFALESVNLLKLSKRELDSLSDGERQRAMIAFALAQDSDIILMDEPTAFIDLPSKYEIVKLLKDLSLKGKTVIFSTHDLHTAIREVDTIWLMLDDGLTCGAPEDLALNNFLNRLFENTEVYLDFSTGTFLHKAVSNFKISLTADSDYHYIWTKRALERIGYSVTSDENSIKDQVKCSSKDNFLNWKVSNGSSTVEFKNINQLCKYLKFHLP